MFKTIFALTTIAAGIDLELNEAVCIVPLIVSAACFTVSTIADRY